MEIMMMWCNSISWELMTDEGVVPETSHEFDSFTAVSQNSRHTYLLISMIPNSFINISTKI